MERISLANNQADAVVKAAAVLRAGGVIVYPTDTLYGLGAAAFSDTAVARVYAIKERDVNKPVHCVVADLEMAEQYAVLDARSRLLAEKFLPGPLTLVVKKKKEIAGGIARDMNTIGIRIPAQDFCTALARAAGPFTTTSANKAGVSVGQSVDSILTQLGDAAEKIDLVVDAGTLPPHAPSTVVDLSGDEVKIVREGAVSAAEIHAVLDTFRTI